MTQDVSPFSRPATGFAGQPQPSTQEQTYVDGFRPGDVKYSYGVLDMLLKVNPGWYLADGTVVLQDGTTPPDLRGRFIIGADGTTFPHGGTGGTASHVHPFTHEAAHNIIQPVFDAPAAHAITQPVFTASGTSSLSHTHNHDGSAVTAHGITQPVVRSHTPANIIEIAQTPGSGIWTWVWVSAAAAGADLAHGLTTNVALSANHTVTQPTAHDDHSLGAITLTRTVDVALTNNHAAPVRSVDVALGNNSPTHVGGSVDAATGVNKYPPYAALWPLIKKF